MNVTQGVISDLLPVYFSGEASNDTKSLVEDYFRQNPDFERLARSAGTPLETLRAAPPVAAGSEKERHDFESIRCGLNRRKWLFGLSLFLTLSPFWFYLTHGHLASLIVGDNLLKAAFDWSMAAVFWFLYFAQLRRRATSLVIALSFTLIPIPFALHFANAPGGRGTFAEAVCIWIGAVFSWIGYLRQRSH